MTNRELAEAFSGHDFERTFPHLAEDVTWDLVGATRLTGREAVVAACRDTAEGTRDVTTTFTRFVTTADGDVVAVDAVGRYDGPGGTTVVSSCDIYEFTDGLVRAITSYTVEVDR